VNFTLGFSARQNVMVTKVARPDYLNIFLGRIGAFITENKLGDGSGAGEMAVIAAQNWVTGLSAENPWQTKLIAASLRNCQQLELLAGADVFTIPPSVAIAGRKELSGEFRSRMHENYDVNLYSSAGDARIEKFSKVDDKVLNLAESLSENLPASGPELVKRAHQAGCGDMFPSLTKEEKAVIENDGKIPVHSKWAKRTAEGTIAPDTLLTLAGLASFTADQRMLDQRIRGLIE